MHHQFSLHQIVRFSSASRITRLSPDGLYEVIRLMPQDTVGDFSYRLRSSAGERVALEHELAPGGPTLSTASKRLTLR